MTKRWLGPVDEVDNFGDKITDEFVDGKTKFGSAWATMSPDSYSKYGVGLGTGLGQRYRLTDGEWIKVEG